jgi:hypothetical protein
VILFAHPLTDLGRFGSSGGLLDPSALLTGAGPWVVALIIAFIFIETGLLFPSSPGTACFSPRRS